MQFELWHLTAVSTMVADVWRRKKKKKSTVRAGGAGWNVTWDKDRPCKGFRRGNDKRIFGRQSWACWGKVDGQKYIHAKDERSTSIRH